MTLNGLITFCPSFHRSADDALDHTGGHARPGLCSYGRTMSCCLGWRNVNGICQRRPTIQRNYNDILPTVHMLSVQQFSKATKKFF